MRCDVCGEKRAVTLTHEVRLPRGRVVRWTVCVKCELKERQNV